MANVIVEVSKFLMMILFALYTFECFAAFRGRISVKKRERIFKRQIFFMYLIHLDGYLCIYAATDEIQVVLLYFLQMILITVLLGNYQLLYPNASRLVTNNMCMLLIIGFIILTRLSYDKVIRQYIIAVASTIIIFIIPVLIRKLKVLRKLTWLYAAVGIIGLAAVTIFGATSYGAKLSVSIGGFFSIQPSEFIKIIFVFFVACMLHQNTEFKQVCITTVVAALHVLVLVASKDLGGALIFFITYLVMLYVATRKLFYFAGGILTGCIAAVLAYELFSHVRVRVLAWSDPLSVIDNEGYQICQSLFAIGTGGWFGTGLYQGSPNKIPVVEQDFVFSAISEEMGGIFALCLIMVCVSCFLMFLNIAMQMKDQFYKLVALGLGTVYAFQVFLTIGGVTKFIPSTGVTLPLVSYGGSSLLSTMILFAIIQGLYILRQDQGETNGKQNTAGRTRFDEEIEDFS
ncbi:MAG: FtsW/RodA/SpoVE family cell cycle protein [Clostridiales bacterium]|nr:FtsW/RodA/SpoVE family cell cycle protein [Clostridiales bacterium]